MASKHHHRTPGRSGQTYLKPAFKLAEEGFVPALTAVISGLLLGFGLAYALKKQFIGERKPHSGLPVVEELSPVTSSIRMEPNQQPELIGTTDIRNSERLGSGAPALPAGSAPRALSVDAPDSDPPRNPRGLAKPSRPARTEKPKLASSQDERRTSGARSQGASANRTSPSNLPSNLAIAGPESLGRAVSLSGLTYSRPLFLRCSEDCLLPFRSAEGGLVKARLKKSAFQRVLSSQLSHVDLDGFEATLDGERIVVVRTLRGHPVRVDAAKNHDDRTSDSARMARTKRDTTLDSAGVGTKTRLDTRGRNLEAPLSAVDEPAEDGEESEEAARGPSSFQERLRKTIDD